MNILLLGDYSSLQDNLKDGLSTLGHEVTLASYADGFKNVERDINLGGGGTDLKSRIQRKLSPLIKIKSLLNFDVVQYVNPLYFYHGLFPNKYAINRIIEGNDKFFITAAGDDAYFWRHGRRSLAYGPFDDFLKYDIKKRTYFMEHRRTFNFNEWIVGRSSGIIPIMYEYEISYRNCPKLLPTIPIPINTAKIGYRENTLGNKLVVFHGLNRYGFKGTRHIEEAFEILSKRYPRDLELVIAGGLPLRQYLDLMKRVNIVIDQTSSYSLGMNGMYAMALGKIVLGGAEPESLASLGVKTSPAINIKPSAKSIVDAVEGLLARRKDVPAIGNESRIFVEKNHDYIAIADKYIKQWNVK